MLLNIANNALVDAYKILYEILHFIICFSMSYIENTVHTKIHILYHIHPRAENPRVDIGPPALGLIWGHSV